MDIRFRFMNKAIIPNISSLLFLFILSNVFLVQSVTANQSFSIMTGTGIPVSGLNSWYNSAPILGLQYIIDNNENSKTIIEFHYQLYSDNSLSDREFYWAVDRNNYLPYNFLSKHLVYAFSFKRLSSFK